MFDAIAKLLVNSFVYEQCLSTMLQGLLRRHLEDATFVEYVIKFTGVALAAIYKSFKQGGAQRLDQDRRLAGNGFTDALDSQEVQKELMAKTFRAVITNSLRDIILLQHSEINSQIDSKVLFTNREISKLLGYNYKGTVQLIMYLSGQDDGMIKIEEYDKEMKAIETLKANNRATYG